MATKLFLRDSASDLTLGAATNKALLLQQGSVKVASDNTATVGGPTSGVQVKKSSVVLTWFSNPLNAVTISGTVTFNLWGLESATQANAGLDVLVERCDQAGNVISQIARSERGTELGTSAALQNWTASPTSTTLDEGDRVKVTVFGNDAGGNMGNGRTFTLDYGAGTGVDGDSYVQFNESITEGAVAAETGAGSDAASVSASLTAAETAPGTDAASAEPNLAPGETAPGTDAATSSAALELTESGPGIDTATITAAADIAETSPGADALALSVEILLNESGAGTDALDATENAPEDQEIDTGDEGAGTDAAGASAAITLAEGPPGADQLATTTAVPTEETGAGTDAAAVTAATDAGETAPGADALTASAAIAAGETAPGSDSALPAAAIPLAETGAGVDALSITVTVDLGETAPGSDGASEEEDSALNFTLGETGAGVDAARLAANLTVAEGAPGRDKCFAIFSAPFRGRRRRPRN